MRIAGIDCGLSGGIACVETSSPFDTPKLIAAMALPVAGEGPKRRIDVSALKGWLRLYRPSVAFVERSQAMPQQGSSSGFIYGRATGSIEATVLCCDISLEIIEASAWKRRFTLKGKDKEGSRQRALMMFPEHSQSFARKKDHNVAEAVLIAVFGSCFDGGFKTRK